MTFRLEHANLVVRDVDGLTRFLQTAFPDFRIRAEGKTLTGGKWAHVGTEETYIALTEATEEASDPFVPYAGKPGTNHLGYEVDDVEALRVRLAAAGYTDSTYPNSHPHRQRVYFRDAEGNDWEFVQYHSLDPKERNDYELH